VAANRDWQERPDAVTEWLAARGIRKEAADTFRLGGVVDPLPEHEQYRGWLSIPYIGYTDDRKKKEQIRRLRFRCIPDHVPPGLPCRGLPASFQHLDYVGRQQTNRDPVGMPIPFAHMWLV